eukprot:290582-Rhodomonas_salina.1
MSTPSTAAAHTTRHQQKQIQTNHTQRNKHTNKQTRKQQTTKTKDQTTNNNDADESWGEGRSIGVGMYQHDLDAKKLASELRIAVEIAVNAVIPAPILGVVLWGICTAKTKTKIDGTTTNGHHQQTPEPTPKQPDDNTNTNTIAEDPDLDPDLDLDRTYAS